MELEDLFRLKRVADPQVSPDGTRVAYVVTEVLKPQDSELWHTTIFGWLAGYLKK